MEAIKSAHNEDKRNRTKTLT